MEFGYTGNGGVDLGMSFYLSPAIFISVSHLQHSIHHFFHPG